MNHHFSSTLPGAVALAAMQSMPPQSAGAVRPLAFMGYHGAMGLPQDSGLLQITGAGAPTDQSCPDNQLVDAVTWQCAPMCPDDSRPVNGKCIGYSGAPLAAGQTIFAGKVIPKWVLWAAGGVALAAVGFIAWRLFGAKGAVATAKAARAASYGIW